MHIANLVLEPFEVVRPRLDAHEQSVERRDIDADRVVAGLERLHERRARAGERVEHAAPRPHVPLEQRLDELRTNLPRYGWSRWTCFVRSRSGSWRSDHERARSIPL